MNRTNKNDWFADSLGEAGYIVSGHLSFSNYLGVNKETVCTIRFINKGDFLKIILLLEVPLVDSFDFKIDADAVHQLNQVFRNDLLLVIFDENIFSVSTDGGETFIKKNSEELEDLFFDMNADITRDKGAYKEINRSTNDSFQVWTRAHLTRWCTVNDIDAIKISTASIILELKRVEEDLKIWRPYLDDYYNYVSFLLIAKRFVLKPRVIAYSSNFTDHVAVHVISDLGSSKSYIDGQFIILTPDRAIADSIPEAKGNMTRYRSTNRRVRR